MGFLRYDAQWQGVVPARKNGESQSWEANWVITDCGLLLGVVALLGITGCWGGTNTVRISSVPSGASLYVNGEHAGETPKSVPSKWWCNTVGVRWRDALRIVLSKDGYQTFERTLPHSELDHRYWSGDCAHGSEFGWGATFGYTFHLVAED